MLCAIGGSLLTVLISPATFMVDDAWFYLQIGRNIASGLGSTFDGQTPTNGYHPLWQAIVSGIGLVSTDRTWMLYSALVLQLGAVLAALSLLYAHAIARGAPYPLAVPIALLLSQYTDKGWLSEGPLTALLLAGVLFTQGWGSGVLLGLLFLTRLDTVFFVGALLVLRRCPRTAAGAAIVAVPWVLWTLASTGHLMPVSGAIKSTFPLPDFSNPIAKIGWTGVIAAAGSAAALGFAAVRPERRVLLASVGAGGLLHAVYTGLFTGPLWSTFVPYYWIIGSVAAGLAVGELLVVYLGYLPSLTLDRRKLLIGAMAAVLSLAGLGRAAQSIFQDDPTIELGRWIASELPESRIAVLDAPGRIAWFSGRPVLAFDGLTRDHDFSQTLTEQGAEAWARRHGVTHLVAYDVPIELPWASIQADETRTHIRFRAPATGEPAGEASLDRGQAVKRLIDLVPAETNAASLYAWP